MIESSLDAIDSAETAAAPIVEPSLPDTPLFVANLVAFATYAPDLHAQLARMTSPASKLILLPGGGVDMSLQGQLFYGADAIEGTEAQLQAFLANPRRLYFGEPDPMNLAGAAGEFCKSLCAQMKADGIEIDRATVGTDAHFTIVFGAGLGFHIEPLIAHTDCRVLLIIEPTLENIFHSLSVVDWAEIFAEAHKSGREILFIIKDDVEGIITTARNAIRARNPALLDGIYVYWHYSNSVLEAARERFERDLFLNLSGLGFFEDELRMMANACANLGQEQTMVINRQMPVHETPLFILGSGPSIDKDLDFIKENRDRAVLMSIGTGLRGLLAKGIKPDYHVELENEFNTAYIVGLVAEEFDVSGITLIGSYSIQKKVVDQFDEAFFYFRERASSTMLFGDGFQQISPAGPTVANTAMATAIRFGFKNIYLFGVDMGSKDQSLYHCSGSVYGEGVLDEPELPHIPIPGNFGGTAYAENILIWSRHSLENMLGAHGYVRCINCSDGARMKNATPALARTIELSEEVDHEVVKQQIRSGVSVLSEGRRRQSWYLPLRGSEMRVVIDAAYDCLDRAAAKADPDLDWVHELASSLRYEAGTARSAALSFFYGSVLLMLGSSWWYDRRLVDANQRVSFRKTVIVELRKTLEYMDKRVGQLYQEIEDYFNGEIEIIEAPHEQEWPDRG
ncbi:MAG: motility associated factor glycosyltransferase family protein [Alphaproteobacteria bacterium]